MICRVLFAAVVAAIAAVTRGELVWHGGNFGGGEGAFEATANGFALVKTKGPGGCQALAMSAPLGEATSVEITFRHRGDAGSFRFGYRHTEDGRTVPTKDAMGQNAGGSVKLSAAAEWRDHRRELQIPASFRLPGNRLNLQFQLWGGQTARRIEIAGVKIEAKTAAEPTSERETKRLSVSVKPLPNDVAYGPLERLERHDWSWKGGWLSDGGRPVFLVGNGCDLGAAQSTPTGLWLAKMQGVGIVSLESGLKFGAGKVVDDHVDIVPTLSVGNVSWQRECLRLGMLTESCNGHGQFERSPIKGLTKAYPDFGEIHGKFGHGICIDNLTELGRKIVLERRLPFVDRIAAEGDYLFELNREPGPNPRNRRTLNDFRAWARKKYGTLEEACRVWRRTYVSWDDVLPIHLDSRNMAERGHEAALRKFAIAEYPEMNYDWIAFVQEQTLTGTANEVTDLRSRYPNLPYGIDTRAHQTYSDGYCSYDPVRIDSVMDLMFIHNGFHAYDYNGTPWDAATLADETWFPLLLGSYFRCNTVHPIIDAEDIVGRTGLPGSNAEAMARNDVGALHLSPWKFRLESAGEDGMTDGWMKTGFDDSGWGDVTVPGSWDDQAAYKGKSGIGWYRKTFVAKANRQDYLDGSRKFLLYGKGVAQSGTVWLNGTKVGDVKGWSASYSFDVGRLLNFGKENTIVWRVDGKGYSNGLRMFCHILAHDQINESRPFGEKQYASMYWNWLMRGLSASFTWNWNKDVLRPYLAQISKEVKYAASVALPDIRTRRSKVAYLYGYLYGRGLPCSAASSTEPYMNWFNAILFSGIEPDVLCEEALQERLNVKDYPLLVVPSCGIVHDRTLVRIREYVKAGGRLVLTEGSLEKTFTRYERQPPIEGAVVAKSDLGVVAAMEFLRPYLPKPEVAVAAEASGEHALVERKLVGDADRKILYVHNWGGLDQRLKIRLPEDCRGWKLASIRGDFADSGDGTVSVVAAAQAPSVAVISRTAPVDRSEYTISSRQRAEIDRVLSLNETVDVEKADVLFPCDASAHTPVGKELYPEVLAALKARKLTHAALDPARWTAELLAGKRLVVIPEHRARSYAGLTKDGRFRKLLSDYVANGGSVLFLAHTARTINSGAPLMESCGKAFGYVCAKKVTRDDARAGFGDPYQIRADVAGCGPLTEGVGKVQLYVLSPLTATKGSAAKTVVPVPGGAAMLAVEHGKGRVFVSADNMFCQPYRITEADNAALLANVMEWLVK